MSAADLAPARAEVQHLLAEIDRVQPGHTDVDGGNGRGRVHDETHASQRHSPQQLESLLLGALAVSIGTCLDIVARGVLQVE